MVFPPLVPVAAPTPRLDKVTMNYFPPDMNSSADTAAPFLPHAGAIALSYDASEERRLFGFDESDENTRPFNLLRTQVARMMDESGYRLIGITSPTPAAGKTYVSLNLAAAMANLNNRPVILCDLDLRRGSVREILDREPPTDLSAYLRGEASDWSDALYRIEGTCLYVAPCVPHPRGSSELLSAPSF